MSVLGAALALAMQSGAMAAPEGYANCRAVMIGQGSGPASEPALRCQRSDGGWELLRGHRASPSPAPAISAPPEGPEPPAASQTDLPTRAEAIASMQGRPYVEVVAEQAAAETHAREERARQEAASARRRSATEGVPAPSRGDATPSPLNQRIAEAFAQAYVRAPANSFGVSTGVVTSHGSQVITDLGLTRVVYTFTARGAACRPQRAAQRCSFELAVASGGHVMGIPIPSLPAEWNRWTSEFQGGAGALRSEEIDDHMARFAASQLANGQSGSSIEWEMPFGDIQGCSIGFVDIC